MSYESSDKQQRRTARTRHPTFVQAVPTALTGAASGALVGSVIPGAGAVVGAIIGGIIGASVADKADEIDK